MEGLGQGGVPSLCSKDSCKSWAGSQMALGLNPDAPTFQVADWRQVVPCF